MTGEEINSWDDATWILTSAFVIFTMQSGEIVFIDNTNIEVSSLCCFVPTTGRNFSLKAVGVKLQTSVEMSSP